MEMEQNMGDRDCPSKSTSRATAIGNSLTIHGLPHMFTSKQSMQRFIWLTIFLCSSAALGYSIHCRVTKYLSKLVTWNETHLDQDYLTMPMVAICDHRGDRISTYQRTFGILYCEFEKHNCIHNISIAYDRYNVCLYINTSGLLQFVAESEFSFHLTLYVDAIRTPSSSFIGSHRDMMIQLFLYEAGYYPLQQSGKYLLSPQYHHDIAITKQIIKRLPYPYPSECKRDLVEIQDHQVSETDSKFHLKSYMYTEETCFYKFFLHILQTKCNETEHNYNFHPEKDKILSCLRGYYVKAKTEDRYSKRCPLPCERAFFGAAIARLKLSERLLKASDLEKTDGNMSLRKGINSMDHDQENAAINKSIMSLNIYHKALSIYEREEIEIYSFDSLISDIGGLMGLFLGASLYSLIELALLVFVFVSEACQLNCLGKTKETKE